jgi:hypothetical protein
LQDFIVQLVDLCLCIVVLLALTFDLRSQHCDLVLIIELDALQTFDFFLKAILS